jgi:heat shock protein HslJ|tara:strand:+ start:168 stop:317 length:150 start_codon:yes stop_codon:yes gene_type:complete
MGCGAPEGIMEQEISYLRAFQTAESYEIKDGELQISSGTNVLNFKSSEE